MPPTPTIILIGMRGSGKTTLGERLAHELHVPFVDLDLVTARACGAETTADALRALGLPAFREAEARALRDVLEQVAAAVSSRPVLALGGGTPTSPDARALLEAERGAARARIVYLRCTPRTLRDRLSGSDLTHRPSLTGRGVLEEIEEVFAARDAMYSSLADVSIDMDSLGVEAALAAIRHVATLR